MRTPLAAFLLLSQLALAQAPSWLSEVKEHRLANGMVWLIVERPGAPVFSGIVKVRVGGADEQPGQTGLAHLFEHMAFKGTPMLGTKDFEAEKKLLLEIAEVGDGLAQLERTGQGETAAAKAARARLLALNAKQKELTDENALAALYQHNGGVGLNATTDKDLTSYFVSLPKNRLQLWLTVEAQRFASPVLRDFYTERDVVQEERRMSIDSNPSGALYEELNQVAFVSSPYRWPTVGYDGDLRAMSLGAAHDFFRKYYVPANAVGAIVGDVKAAEVVALLEQTFGSIPARPRPAPPEFAEPPARAQRRSAVTFEASPRLLLAFHKPAPPAREDDVFDVLSTALGDGRTSRLYKRLVLEEHLAQGVGTFTAPGSRLPGLFVISVTPLKGVGLEQLERVILEELAKVVSAPLGAEELERARVKLGTDFARSIESNQGLAANLALGQVLFDDWRYGAQREAVVATITPAEVRDVAAKYLRPEQRVVVSLVAPAAPSPARAPAAKGATR